MRRSSRDYEKENLCALTRAIAWPGKLQRRPPSGSDPSESNPVRGNPLGGNPSGGNPVGGNPMGTALRTHFA